MVKKYIIFFYLLCTASIYSNDIEVILSSNKSKVAANEVFQINFQVSSPTENFELKKIEISDTTINLQKVGRSFMKSKINGEKRFVTVFSYLCRISNTGVYEIGPFIIEIDEAEYKTNVLKINVDSAENINHNETIDDDEELYKITLTSNKLEVYENESFDVEVNILKLNNLEFLRYKHPEYPTIVWREEIHFDKTFNTKIINNKKYVEFLYEKNRLYISKSGTYTIKPCEMLILGKTNKSMFPEKILLKSEPLVITVKPLPKNKPENFKEYVGDFEIESSISKSKIKSNEPITLNIKLKGKGNFHGIEKIGIKKNENFEEYTSKGTSNKNNNLTESKSWEILLVPSNPGFHKIQLNDFHFFDPVKQEYKTLKGNTFYVEVEKTKAKNINTEMEDNNSKKNDLTSDAVTMENSNNNNNNLMNIKYIKFNIGSKKNPFRYKLWSQLIISIFIIIIVSMLLIICIKFIIIKNLLNHDIINKKNAYKSFTREMSYFISKNNIPVLNKIDDIYNIIEKYIKTKFDIKSINFTSSGLKSILKNYISKEEITELIDIISKLDMIRFMDTNISNEDFNLLITRINTFIKNIENNKRN